LVAFIIKNPIDLDLTDEIDPVRRKRTSSSDFLTVAYTITSLYPNPIIPQFLWLAIWNWLLEHLRHMPHGRGLQKSVRSQIFLRCIRANLDLIMNAEHFAQIDQMFDHKRNHCKTNIHWFSS